MLVFSMAICFLTGFTLPETGAALPGESMTMQGYSSLSEPAVPGVGEWTGNGPWGGNLKGLAAAYSDNSIVLAGCGFSMTADAGGVFRSTDGGASWAETELFPIQVNDVCSGGPQAPNTFYAGTRTGLYKSSDLGVTWATVSGMSTSYVIGIGASSGDGDILIAGLSSNNGIRRTEDGGTTWSEVGLSSGFMKGFGCDPEHPDTMYVAMSGLDYSLYRSTDAGLTWSSIGPAVSGWGVLVAPFGTAETIIVTTSDGFYMTENYGADWTLVVSGSSYAPAVCDGTNLYAPVISGGGVYESTDQGQNWTLNTQGIVASYWQAGCASSAGYLAGHYGGVYRTSGVAGNYFVSQDGISNGYFRAVSCSAADNTLLAGGDYHGLWKSTDQGTTWEVITPGPANWTIYDIAPQSDLYYSGPVRYLATADGVFRSDDSGDSWVPAGLSGTQISSIAFDPSDPDNAWAGTATAGVHYTTDGGGIWTAGTGFPFALYPSVELMMHSSGEYRILVTFQQNGAGVYYSDDGGVSYTEVPVSGSYHPDIVSTGEIYPSAFAYLATDTGVWESNNYGESWYKCASTSGLMWDVLAAPDADVFAGSNGTGAYWSGDSGVTWEPLNTGIENKVVWNISHGVNPNQLFACIRGFGVYELTDDQLGVNEPEGNAILSISPLNNPVTSAVNFTVTGIENAAAELSIYSSAGRIVYSGDISAESGYVWLPGEEIPAGVYLVRLASDGRTASSKVVLLR